MKNKNVLLRGVCVLCAIVWVYGGIQAQPVVSPSPLTNNEAPSTQFSVSINVTYVSSIRGASIALVYDRRVLQYVTAVAGPLIAGTLMMPPSVTAGVSTTFDTLLTDQARLGPGASSGSGTLFIVTFNSTLAGATPLIVQKADLRDASNQTISVTLQNGQAAVYPVTAVYVDASYTSANSGGHFWGYDAFATVTNGLNAVAAGGTLNVAAGTYNETVSITKNVTLTGTGNPAIQNLTVNTPAVALGGSIHVSDVLTLTSGVVTTGSNAIVITNDQPGGVVITSGCIAGEIDRAIAAGNTGLYLFTNQYAAIVPSASQAATTVSFRSCPGEYPPECGSGQAINRYYCITTSGSFIADELRLTYASSELNGISPLNLTPFYKAGSAWTIAEAPVTLSDHVVALSNTHWNLWTLADGLNPLPIQLSSFTGRVINGDVRLEWTTLSETHNYGFEVQKSSVISGPFVTIPNSFVHGYGTTNVPHNYTFADVNAQNGEWFYRLRQIDLDSQAHYTEPIHVSVITNANAPAVPAGYRLDQNFPNPFNPETEIHFTVASSGPARIELYNLVGQIMGTLFDGFAEAGQSYRIRLNAANLASGVYIYRLTAGEFTGIHKLVVLK